MQFTDYTCYTERGNAGYVLDGWEGTTVCDALIDAYIDDFSRKPMDLRVHALPYMILDIMILLCIWCVFLILIYTQRFVWFCMPSTCFGVCFFFKWPGRISRKSIWMVASKTADVRWFWRHIGFQGGYMRSFLSGKLPPNNPKCRVFFWQVAVKNKQFLRDSKRQKSRRKNASVFFRIRKGLVPIWRS